ncbi:MAG: deoxyribose-phosphate aldolase [Ruthenibacterium sp.]
MTKQEILARVDHTLLKPEATWQQIQTLCDEAIANHTACVCINPGWVKQAVAYLDGRVPVCTVIGFPLGATTTAAKVAEAKDALANGCAEFDMVINIGRLKMGDTDDVREEIRALKQAVGDQVLKVIIETCLLTKEEKEKMCALVCEAGADFIKTSTGFSTDGATFEDIALFARCVKGRCKIKAAGGIRSVADMEKFIALGADRLGTSSAIKIFDKEDADGSDRSFPVH